MTPAITAVRAREVLDCRGLPTIQADVVVDSAYLGRADVPTGRSRGAHEAVELRDGGRRLGGQGVGNAIVNVRDVIGPALIGEPVWPQRALDQRLVALDGTPDKHHLGANALCAVSLAAARAAAAALGVPLYRSLAADAHVLPVPQVNLINGGRHAQGSLDFQEFIVMPIGADSFREAITIASEVNLVLGDLIRRRYGAAASNVGDEGGYAPPMSDPREALELLHQASVQAGHDGRVAYGLDCAATHLYDDASGTYRIGGRNYSVDELLGLYRDLLNEFNIVSIEDPFHEDDYAAFAELTHSSEIQIVGDDLFTTNVGRLRTGIARGAGNALLLKVNQVGTLSEALDAAHLALRHGLGLVVSERSGETEDPLIADLSVSLGAGQIKTGAPVRGERTAKYNRLLLIEEELGSAATYAGAAYRRPN